MLTAIEGTTLTAIGKALRKLREERGLSVRQLAALVGLHYTNVAAKERGASKIRPPERKKFAEALGLSLDEFDSHWRAAQIEQTVGGVGIPVINRAPAGLVTDYEEYGVDSGQGFEYIERGNIEDPHAFALIIVGESMEPAIRDGDYCIFSPVARVPRPRATLEAGHVVFVRTSPEAKNPGCCVARFKGNVGGLLEFTKDNRKHKGFAVPTEHISQLAVMVEHRKSWA